VGRREAQVVERLPLPVHELRIDQPAAVSDEDRFEELAGPLVVAAERRRELEAHPGTAVPELQAGRARRHPEGAQDHHAAAVALHELDVRLAPPVVLGRAAEPEARRRHRLERERLGGRHRDPVRLEELVAHHARVGAAGEGIAIRHAVGEESHRLHGPVERQAPSDRRAQSRQVLAGGE